MGRRELTKPIRPGLPLLLPCALSLWAVAAIVYAVAREWEATQLVAGATLSAGVALACVIVLVLLRHRASWKAYLAIALLGCALGGCCGCAGALMMQADAAYATQQARTWTCVLTQDAKEGSFGINAFATATSDEGRSVSVRLELPADRDGFSASELTCGTRLRITGQASAPSVSSAEYLWNQGACAFLRTKAPERLPLEGATGAVTTLRDRAIGLIREQGGGQAGILGALVCGYRVPLEEQGAYEDYKTVGLAHVVAVSGAHLAIVTATLGALLRALRVAQRATLIVLALFAVVYVMFAGVPVSAVRAAFMVLLMLAGRAVRRRSASLNALALCIIAFIAIDPPCAVSVSFFLSCASTMGIVLFGSLFAYWFSWIPDRARKLVADPLGLTLASNTATLPFSAALFSQVPLIAPLSNVLATPLFSLGCVFGLASTLVSCAVPAAAPVLIGAASIALVPLSALTGALAAVPFACIPASLPLVPMLVLSCALCIVLWMTWPMPKLRTVVFGAGTAVVCTALLIFGLPLLRGDAIVMLDVGQGDSFLIRSGGHAVLIDTGNQDAKLREALGRNGVYELDAVIITHGDDDHCGSLDQLAAVTNLRSVLLAHDALACDCSSCDSLRASAVAAVGEGNVSGLTVGDVITVGAFRLEVVWPYAFADEGGNADSVCLNVTVDADGDGAAEWRGFFCGDAESDQLEELVRTGALGDVDVLKVGHHGSRAALTQELAETLRPEVALIGVGANNRYGHPTEEALAFLQEAGAQVFRTDRDGDVTLSFSSGSMRVRCAVQ